MMEFNPYQHGEERKWPKRKRERERGEEKEVEVEEEEEEERKSGWVRQQRGTEKRDKKGDRELQRIRSEVGTILDNRLALGTRNCQPQQPADQKGAGRQNSEAPRPSSQQPLNHTVP